MRVDKINYYLDIAEAVAKRSTCLRVWYGSVIVKDDSVTGTGYNGSAKGTPNCCDLKVCRRQELNIPHGERYELCESVHSEVNAIINSKCDLQGATLFLVGIMADTGKLNETSACCMMCKRVIINSGIKKVIIRRTSTDFEIINVDDWKKSNNV
jgi:dCMP deaminase